ncbi:hypothetical protein [Halalkalibacter alkalisediminis]|uniref:Uncharacterized protein n=1 Tax=Halalkalibacter alkalisediminis TaxID=935616 RepID=A0ABV6NG42_9BACI|nr:hypothetical protein [Halalkalibacter alkalisediminis]
MSTNLQKQVYIMSLEGADLYSHMHRGTYIKRDYSGMIPYSLELIQLHKEGIQTFPSSRNENKLLSNDVINVKFNQKVKSASNMIKDCKKKLKKSNLEIKKMKDKYRGDSKLTISQFREDLKPKLKPRRNLERRIAQLEGVVGLDNWQEVKNEPLRKELYEDGFSITNVDKDNNITIDKYVVYKRSSAKSRTGQCLMIKKHLYDNMINWSRMGLTFPEDKEIDLASLTAYESLVGSSIESTVTIDPNRILLISDVKSNFTEEANVVRKSDDGFLESFTESTKISNDLWDGQSLLDVKYFEEGKGMKLLRNHFFKSAAFNTNIQEFLQAKCPEHIDYEEWELTDMPGNGIKAIDVDMITTPNSLKALKFSSVIGSNNDMWDYWKKVVEADGNAFGVCKNEKVSKYIIDGNIMQQTSYQMLNSTPLSKGDMDELTVFEKEYIERLKNDDDVFIKHINSAKTSQNSNEMFVALYEKNNKIVNTKVFKEFRKRIIKDHVNHVKKGKVRLSADYVVMIGNPVEMLYHAIGQFDTVNVESLSLKDNQIHTTLFDFDKKLVGYRNPHTSPSNILVSNNKKVKEIEDYFNFTKNIVAVNAIKFPIQDILSGCDYDSDTLLLVDSKGVLLPIAEECRRKYKVCINKVESEPKYYTPTWTSMYEIDKELAKSKDTIGNCINAGQLCMSRYWDLKANNGDKKQLEKLLKKIDVATVLSGICIDLAKKMYDIEISDEIEKIEAELELKTDNEGNIKKPNFWVKVSKNKNTKHNVMDYDTPMDYLVAVMDSLPDAETRKTSQLSKLLNDNNDRKANYKQKEKVEGYVKVMQKEIEGVHKKYAGISDDEDLKEKKNEQLEEVGQEYASKICKLKIKPNTMHSLLISIESGNSDIAVRLMNTLYTTQKDTFLNAFKEAK